MVWAYGESTKLIESIKLRDVAINFSIVIMETNKKYPQSSTSIPSVNHV